MTELFNSNWFTRRYESTMLNDFQIGCDPEFMLLDAEGKTVPAQHYFGHDGDIGYDHGGRVAEFRPEPSRGVLPIVKKLQALIGDERIIKAGKKLRAGALCNQDSLGGHVHFGFNCFAKKPPEGLNAKYGEFNEKGAKVTKALDVLTKTLEYLDILPKNESAQRRIFGQGYGRYGDVRDCRGHMEYRTMASWLYDPKVAFLCLTAAKLAAVDPEGTCNTLKSCDSYEIFTNWMANYKTKDRNAARASEKLLEKGHKYLVVDPEVDFRGRWERLEL